MKKGFRSSVSGLIEEIDELAQRVWSQRVVMLNLASVVFLFYGFFLITAGLHNADLGRNEEYMVNRYNEEMLKNGLDVIKFQEETIMGQNFDLADVYGLGFKQIVYSIPLLMAGGIIYGITLGLLTKGKGAR